MDANAANSPLASVTATFGCPTSGARGMEDAAGGFGRTKIGNAQRLKNLRRQDVKHGSDGTNRLGHRLSRAARARAGRTAGVIIVPRGRAFRMARDIFMSNAQCLPKDCGRLSCQQQKEHNASNAPKEHTRAKGLGQGGEQHWRRCAKSRKPAPTGQASTGPAIRRRQQQARPEDLPQAALGPSPMVAPSGRAEPFMLLRAA